MKRLLSVLVYLLSIPAFAAAPPVDFSIGDKTTFNSVVNSTATIGGITVSAFTYSAGTYTASQLWLRNDGVGSNEYGFGVCSTGESCGAPGGTGNGDINELSDERNLEVIRLTLPSAKRWSDLWVSSLDAGGTNSNESGILYWSNSATPVLSSLTGASFSHIALNADYGSIWSLVSASIDPTANYLFFIPDAANGSNNDFLVWGAGVTAVPEPDTYAMLLAGLGLLGFIARRRTQQTAA